MRKRIIASAIVMVLVFTCFAAPVSAASPPAPADEIAADSASFPVLEGSSLDITPVGKVYSNGMTEISIKVWQLSGSKKVTRTLKLKVKSSLAPNVIKIFDQIYNGDEKFPIYAVEGYAARVGNSHSEHWKGTAIDINPTQNAMFYGNTLLAGSFWNPAKSPYSIPPNGDVVKAFKKYGWYWGGKGWGAKKDYMHFSRYGT